MEKFLIFHQIKLQPLLKDILIEEKVDTKLFAIDEVVEMARNNMEVAEDISRVERHIIELRQHVDVGYIKLNERLERLEGK